MMHDITLDSIMLDTWLLVAAVKNGNQIEDGNALYHKASVIVQKSQEALTKQKLSAENIEHITYAQCALLDEAILDRNEKDGGYEVWVQKPLQVKFFNTMNAGELIFERIKSVLNQPSPNKMVLTCFQRVLALGYLGRYKHVSRHELDDLKQFLTEKIGFYEFQSYPVVLDVPQKPVFWRYCRSLYLWIIIAFMAVLFLWLGLNHHLQHLVHELLPAVKN